MKDYYINKVKSYLDERLHETFDSKSELRMLKAIRNYTDLLIGECAIASDEEINNGYTDEYGILYSYDGSKLIKCNNNLIKNYVIKTGTKIICDNAFEDCGLLSLITIPDTVEIIGHLAFCRCHRLKSIQIPNSVRKIGTQVFWYCSALSHVVMPRIKYISHSLFVQCGINEIEIPESVTVLEESCFIGCNFKEIKIPRSVMRIEKKAFSGCSELEILKFESGIKKIEYIAEDAFNYCNSLKIIYVPKGMKGFYAKLFLDKYSDIIFEYDHDTNIINNKSITDYLVYPYKYSTAKEPIGTTWSLLEFIKLYENWEIIVCGDSRKGLIYYGLFADNNKNVIITHVSEEVRNYSSQALKNSKANLVIKVMESKSYNLCTKWE